MLNISLNSPSNRLSQVRLQSNSEDFAFFSPVRQKPYHIFCALARAVLRRPVVIWGLCDSILAFMFFGIAHRFSPQFDPTINHGYQVGTAAVVFSAVLFCACYAQGLYDRHNLTSLGLIVRNACIAAALALAITSIGFGWFKFVRIGRVVLLNSFITAMLSVIFVRIVVRTLARSAQVRLLFVGDPAAFRPLERHLRARFRGFYARPCYFATSVAEASNVEKQLLQTIHRLNPDEIVVQDNDSLMLAVLQQSANILRLGCEIRSHTAYVEELLREVPIASIDSRGMMGQGLTSNRYGANFGKRMLDIVLSLTGVIAASPVMLLVSLAIRLESCGPILYKQTRVGRYGKPFSIYKFRTMCVEAETNGAVWATGRDCRVTPVGRFLRRTRLDELPQLWNILRSDMSFVGPRPERPEFVSKLKQVIPHYDLRHLVPPGLTGWAQVRYRYGASVKDARQKLAFDLYYVRHYGPGFDLAICLRTAVAMAKGAR